MTSPITPLTRKIRLRRAWAEEWESINPILADGEPGFDRTNNMLKIGDGFTPWNELSYLTPPEGSVLAGPDSAETSAFVAAAVRAHINSTTPHPVYDDGPSLLLLYQNAKV
jgi:hypothetical protein